MCKKKTFFLFEIWKIVVLLIHFKLLEEISRGRQRPKAKYVVLTLKHFFLAHTMACPTQIWGVCKNRARRRNAQRVIDPSHRSTRYVCALIFTHIHWHEYGIANCTYETKSNYFKYKDNPFNVQQVLHTVT